MEDGLRELLSEDWEAYSETVLILVLMEDGLRVYDYGNKQSSRFGVLILVLMEDGLRVKRKQLWKITIQTSLNPCFNGRWSARLEEAESVRNLAS